MKRISCSVCNALRAELRGEADGWVNHSRLLSGACGATSAIRWLGNAVICRIVFSQAVRCSCLALNVKKMSKMLCAVSVIMASFVYRHGAKIALR
ncbi:hypothetical protein AM571_CH02374 [Rhizobium etli 8C-3]|uniref:Uncharacterized protein n=1 Tax=Rhizobium etli 8C-3 TaxID=538025 RepID=A0A1L5P4X1_RHIET|nr:hypothetical protein AM571_CH02374 [Rhizobium etli 8C-3]